MATFQVGPPKGLNKDVNNTVIEKEYFSNVENVRFEDGAAKKISGHDNPFPVANPTVAPYQVLNWATGSNNYWFYAGLQKYIELMAQHIQNLQEHQVSMLLILQP